ncbi:phenol degradation protein [Advenella faeciporci]|uniref:Phenol degradation protein n=1 Tax=Advenella faeciporci TaxID=797535 RepID=A0A918JJB3_9BURK|nr:transporter [Advenella faeciporci]GGW83233.1 phenol degradation protein [Advenella faeciporci]
MINKYVKSVILGVTGSLAMTAAVAGGHYVPGVEGIRGPSLPPAGLYYLGYAVHYDIDNFRTPGTKDRLPGKNDGSVSALVNRLVWVTEQKFLGADYGMEAIVPIINTKLDIGAAGVSDSHAGVGDIYVGPLVLGWHGKQWDAVAAAGLWLDNGSTRHAASPGHGYRSLMLTAGGTYHFDEAKTVSASALMRFERNSKDDNGFRLGNQITLEWGLGKDFSKVQAGLVGYSQWQVSNDKGFGATTHHASRHAVGAELVYPVPSAGMLLKGAFYKEVYARAGTGALPKGTLFRLSLVKAF